MSTTLVLATTLAFMFGYLMTILPLLRGGMEIRAALTLAFASDTVSITIMEIVDNARPDLAFNTDRVLRASFARRLT